MILGQQADNEGMRSDLPFAEITKKVGLEPAANNGHANIICLHQERGVDSANISFAFCYGFTGHFECLKLFIGEEYVQNNDAIEWII